MAVLRKQSSQNFTIVPNSLIHDGALSYTARGVFLYLWSLPDGQRSFDFEELLYRAGGNDSRSEIASALAELTKGGYLKQTDGIFSLSIWEEEA
jgi:hypothetical protein